VMKSRAKASPTAPSQPSSAPAATIKSKRNATYHRRREAQSGTYKHACFRFAPFAIERRVFGPGIEAFRIAPGMGG
jgi:hypothetical protein